MTRIDGGEQTHPYKAPAETDCFIGACLGRMRLVMLRPDGTLLQRPDNDGPVYRCNRVGCYYHAHPRGVHEINPERLRGSGREKLEQEHGEVQK